MPAMIRTAAILTATVNPNIFSGSTFEYARVRQVVSLGVTQSATGMFLTFNVGADVVAEEFEPPIFTVYPVIPDSFYLQDVAEQGDRYVLAARNASGGTLTVRAIAILTNV